MIKKNILVADDEPMVTDFMAEFLNKEGYKVISSNDSYEALKKVKTGGINLIMVDADMSLIHGSSIYNIIRNAGGENPVPVIIMSGSGIGPSLIKALTKGADEYIPKPSDIGLIRKKVKECLQRHVKGISQ